MKYINMSAVQVRIPPLKALQAFEATARLLSFSRAAAELFVTQSAISHQIKQLEDFMGHALFIRERKRITLTQEGDTLQSVVSDCFLRLAAVTNHLVQQESVTLKIMAQSSIAVDWLAPRIAQFRKGYPDIDLLLNMAVYASSFDPNEYDIIIGTWPTQEGFVSRKLREEHWYPVCAPSFLQKINLDTPETLLNCKLYSSENGQDWNLWMQQHQIRNPIKLDMQNFSLALLSVRAALAGEGIALSCGFMVDDLVKHGLLVTIPELSYTLPWGHYQVHYRVGSHNSESIEAFVSWLWALCQQ
jgi:LysR family transcriptional regulator, glycine cleavage system transcriptional activator